MMGRARYTFSYDTKDPSNRLVCAILSALGYRRSEVIKAVLEDLAARYGADVLTKESADILLYLIRNRVADAREKPGSVLTLTAFPGPEDRSGKTSKKEKTVREKKPPVSVKQSAAEENPAPVPQITREPEPLTRQQVSDESPEDLDKKRAAIMEYLENGFYEDMEG